MSASSAEPLLTACPTVTPASLSRSDITVSSTTAGAPASPKTCSPSLLGRARRAEGARRPGSVGGLGREEDGIIKRDNRATRVLGQSQGYPGCRRETKSLSTKPRCSRRRACLPREPTPDELARLNAGVRSRCACSAAAILR